MRIARAFPVFSVVFAVIYLVAMYFNLALVSYFPRTRHWYALTVTDLPRSAGTGMYWYGWLATSFLGAAAVAELTLAAPERALSRAAGTASWAVPLGILAAFAYILRTWFLR